MNKAVIQRLFHLLYNRYLFFIVLLVILFVFYFLLQSLYCLLAIPLET
uniref:Uncharacterized protein n=1 Tax=virus sp. ctCsQ3 TaxID=2826794 RepID=A0A8S5R747_9VIRU|nr:MAG TPA: hypothetical protein [virus sp. ctCsQ3]DAW89412.1 MAG TPA: hypothetical protein [Bacteriophage sp.]